MARFQWKTVATVSDSRKALVFRAKRGVNGYKDGDIPRATGALATVLLACSTRIQPKAVVQTHRCAPLNIELAIQFAFDGSLLNVMGLNDNVLPQNQLDRDFSTQLPPSDCISRLRCLWM